MVICTLAIGMIMDVSQSIKPIDRVRMFAELGAVVASPEIAKQLAASRAVFFVTAYGTNVETLIPPRVIETVADAVALGEAIAGAKPSRELLGNTATGEAMRHGAALIEATGCSDQKLNIVSDGETNTGPHPQHVRGEIDNWALTINGVAVGNGAGYLERNVILGPGSFVEAAPDWDGYMAAIERKLGRELQLAAVMP